MNEITRADLERLLQTTDDPSVLIPAAWFAAATGQIDSQMAFTLAASPELARASTPESVAKLAEILAEMAAQLGKDAFGLADMIESHGSALDDLGKCRLALPLYD